MLPLLTVVCHELLEYLHLLNNIVCSLTCTNIINSCYYNYLEPVRQVKVILDERSFPPTIESMSK